MTVKVGLVGFGAAGRYLHAPVIAAADMEIAAIVSSREADVKADWPEADRLTRFEDLALRDDIDLVVLATPHELHYRQAKWALEAGHNVVVEKPFTLTRAEANDLAELADACDLKLAVYQNRRWDSDFLTLRRLIAEGALGEVTGFHMRWDRYRPTVVDRWHESARPGTGMLYNLGPHLIDQTLQLFGRPDWLIADVFTQREGGLSDDGFEILMGKGRLRITLGVSLIVPGECTWRYQMTGTEATFLKAGLDPQETQLREGMRPNAAEFGQEPEDQWGVLVRPDGSRRPVPAETGCWTEFYRGMRRAIEDGTPVPVSARSAAEVIELIELTQQSARTGRRIDLVQRREGHP